MLQIWKDREIFWMWLAASRLVIHGQSDIKSSISSCKVIDYASWFCEQRWHGQITYWLFWTPRQGDWTQIAYRNGLWSLPIPKLNLGMIWETVHIKTIQDALSVLKCNGQIAALTPLPCLCLICEWRCTQKALVAFHRGSCMQTLGLKASMESSIPCQVRAGTVSSSMDTSLN